VELGLFLPVLESWLGDRWPPRWAELSRLAQVTGALVTDAALAALAIEHGARLCTTDRDFARFPGLHTINPLDG
jgi:hypothetical protein